MPLCLLPFDHGFVRGNAHGPHQRSRWLVRGRFQRPRALRKILGRAGRASARCAGGDRPCQRVERTPRSRRPETARGWWG